MERPVSYIRSIRQDISISRIWFNEFRNWTNQVNSNFHTISKMQPLQTTYCCMVWFCICPSDPSISKLQKLAHIIFAIVNSLLLFCDVAANVAFCWRFISIDLERCLSTLMSFSACISTAYSVIIAITLMRRKIDSIFKGLAKIYELSE